MLFLLLYAGLDSLLLTNNVNVESTQYKQNDTKTLTAKESVVSLLSTKDVDEALHHRRKLPGLFVRLKGHRELLVRLDTQCLFDLIRHHNSQE